VSHFDFIQFINLLSVFFLFAIIHDFTVFTTRCIMWVSRGPNIPQGAQRVANGAFQKCGVPRPKNLYFNHCSEPKMYSYATDHVHPIHLFYHMTDVTASSLRQSARLLISKRSKHCCRKLCTPPLVSPSLKRLF